MLKHVRYHSASGNSSRCSKGNTAKEEGTSRALQKDKKLEYKDNCSSSPGHTCLRSRHLSLALDDCASKDSLLWNSHITQLLDICSNKKTMTSNLGWLRGGWNPRMSMSLSSTKGLLNAPGDNNCFLNSAVQVLWHLDVFRRSFRLLSGHACMENSCIFCALKVIFTQFQFSDREALPPDSLRNALAKSFADQQRFQLGFMDDAAECFENILLRIHHHLAHDESEDLCRAPHCIPHQKFAMTVVEQMVCECGATSEPLTFSQMVHYVSTSSLATQYRRCQQGGGASHHLPAFGHMLRLAMSDGGEVRNCPGSCGRRLVQVRRTLTNTPEVVSVGLIWDSDCPSIQHISEVLSTIGTTLKTAEFFHSVTDKRWASNTSLNLVGVVCYYAKHYSTFLFHSKKKIWVLFDDAQVYELDPYWRTVVNKCHRGHFQPLLLLYADPDSVPVITDTAPDKTYVIQNTISTSSSHARQRSFDRLSDGSGTIGGRSESTMEIDQVSSQQQRSVTPNPAKAPHIPSATDRCRTPGPEWGRYHSDDEELEAERKKADVSHFRQPSYLGALDGQVQFSKSAALSGHNSGIYAANRQSANREDIPFCMNNGQIPTQSDAVAIDLGGPVPHTCVVTSVPYQYNDARQSQMSSHGAYPVNSATGYGQINSSSEYTGVYHNSKALTSTSASGRFSQSGSAQVSSQWVHTQVSQAQRFTNHQVASEANPKSSQQAPLIKTSQQASLSRSTHDLSNATGLGSQCSIDPVYNGSDCGQPSHGQCDYSTSTPDQYGTYINPKTVQNILNHQGVKSTNPKPPHFPGHLQQDKPLKLDIPDNSSLNSNQDSGYRSGGSDRCSASSLTSSSCMESPVIDSHCYRVQQKASDHGKAVSVSCHPSIPRLDQIPEHRAALYRSGSGSGANPKPAVAKKPKLRPNNQQCTANFQDADKEVERMLMEAESLMELSNEKQEKNDIPLALLHCDKAIALLQQALTNTSAGQDSLVRVRMKHNSYVLRSRSLHKQLTSIQRQSSNQSSSTVSSDQGLEADHGSVSSSSTDTDHMTGGQGHSRNNYTKQDSGYHGESHHSRLPVSSLSGKSREDYLASAPLSSLLPRSSTYNGLSYSSHQEDEVPQNSSQNLAPSAEERSREVDIYATLPRKPKQKKATPSSNSSTNHERYEEEIPAKNGSLVGNHKRQWSKEDIRSLLVQDFYDRKGKSSRDSSYERGLDQTGKSSRDSSFERNLDRNNKTHVLNKSRSRESSLDSLGSGKIEHLEKNMSHAKNVAIEKVAGKPSIDVSQALPTYASYSVSSASMAPPLNKAPPAVSRSNSNPGRRSLPTGGSLNPSSYEDLINKQLKQMALKEKSRSHCDSVNESNNDEGYIVPEKSHYAYRHQINLPPRPTIETQPASSVASSQAGGYNSGWNTSCSSSLTTQPSVTQSTSSVVYVKPQTPQCAVTNTVTNTVTTTSSSGPIDAAYFVGVSGRAPVKKAASHGQLTAHAEALSLGGQWRVARAESPVESSTYPTVSVPSTGGDTHRNQPANEQESIGAGPVEGAVPAEEEWPAPPPSLVNRPLSPSPCTISSSLICGPTLDHTICFEKGASPDGNKDFNNSDIPDSPMSGKIHEPVISRPVVQPMVQAVEVENIVVQPSWSVQAACTCSCHKSSPVKSRLKPCDMCKQTHKIVAKVERSMSNSSSSSSAPKLMSFQQPVDETTTSQNCSSSCNANKKHSSDKKESKHKSHRRSHSPEKSVKKSSCEKNTDVNPSNPKSALARKKKKNRKARKSVTFCDDVALISTTEDKPPEVDYMQYVMRHLQHRKDRLQSLSSSSSSITSSSMDSDLLSLNRSDLSSSSISGSRSSSGGQGQGYDSDFDEDESEDEIEEEPENADQVKCSLCRRRWVDPPHVYCSDCDSYMSQFQASSVS